MAGINAAMLARGLDPIILLRSESYIGVLIDDLINKGTEEPYRIFTSRAEYRLCLRQDNADTRLMRIGNRIGLVPDELVRELDRRERVISDAICRLNERSIRPSEVNTLLERKKAGQISEPVPIIQILRRPEIKLEDLLGVSPLSEDGLFQQIRPDQRLGDRIEIEAKYEGYVKRQNEQIRAFERSEAIRIPPDFDYASVKSLSREGREKLGMIRPESIGQASRISGVTPADLSVVLVSLKAGGSTCNMDSQL
jgi:tRNA uridine 5-carboxymethylaminomethyl modification enzyme